MAARIVNLLVGPESDGMRLDAVKHINEDFMENFVGAMRKKAGPNFFTVAEYWKDDTRLLDTKKRSRPKPAPL